MRCAELNEAISELLEKLNHRPFRKREGSRASLFAELDRPALQPLPADRYILAHWKTVRASIDYHVEVDRHYYSVPYQLAGQKLEARYTATTVEIFHGGKRVASHLRSSAAYRHTTVSDHMPKSHQAHLEWTPSRLIHWAEGIGAGHRRSRPHYPGAQAAPGDGVPRLPGHPESGENLLPAKTGSGQPACRATAGFFLSESEVDSEALARPPTRARSRGRSSRPSP